VTRIRYVTIGIYYAPDDTPDFRILIIEADDETAAVEIAEGLGNVAKTTRAWTDESFAELASDCCAADADFVQADDEQEER
jgi:hypothetical protein